MHGQNHIKFVCAKQAKIIHQYKSLKRRLYSIYLAFYFHILTTIQGQNHIKFVGAKQAKTIDEYKSLKRRLCSI